jgi:3-oxoacyl-[acyl-carrier protein] reductase
MKFEELNEKIVIITGATGGIGAAVAKAFLQQGAVVVAGYYPEPFHKEFESYGEKVIALCGDLSEPSTSENLVSIAHDLGGPHVVVNTGGNFLPGPLLEIEHEDFRKVVSVHLFGTWYLSIAAIKKMIDAQIRGSIIHLTSRTGFRGYVGEANYAAAKGGVCGLTLAMAEEVKEFGIRVNAIAPVAWSVRAESLDSENQNREIIKRSNNVLGRPGLPEDIAPVALFLASDMANYITGQIIQATGESMHLM